MLPDWLKTYLASVIQNASHQVSSPSPTPQLTNSLAPLYTEGNQIKRSDTGQPIRLKGAVSDYFRFNATDKRPDNLVDQNEFKALHDAKKSGANVIGLYVGPNVSDRLPELDNYINEAKKQGMYVYINPVYREFSNDPTKVSDTMSLLSKRYQNQPHIVYGLGAEGGAPFDQWIKQEMQTAQGIRQNAPNAVLMGTPDQGNYYETPYNYVSQSNNGQPGQSPKRPILPLKNMIYETGGYIKSNDAIPSNPNYESIRMKGISQGIDPNKYPVIAGEFGGNVGGDFSSPKDLAYIRQMLDDLQKQKTSYTGFALSPTKITPANINLYDQSGNPTPRGALYKEYFSR